MVLLPLLNIGDMLKGSLFNFSFLPMLFMIVCINAIVFGIGLIGEAKNRTNGIYYKLSGAIAILQSTMFLSAELSIIHAGLIISIICSGISALILYKESRNVSKHSGKSEMSPAFS